MYEPPNPFDRGLIRCPLGIAAYPRCCCGNLTGASGNRRCEQSSNAWKGMNKLVPTAKTSPPHLTIFLTTGTANGGGPLSKPLPPSAGSRCLAENTQHSYSTTPISTKRNASNFETCSVRNACSNPRESESCGKQNNTQSRTSRGTSSFSSKGRTPSD